MEVLESVSLLHSLDVLVEAVFARQLVRPGTQQREAVFLPSATSADAPVLPGEVVDLLEVLEVA